MPGEGRGRVIYWDTSALLSCLILDSQSTDARSRLAANAYHLVSSLAFAEVHAVLARLARKARKRGDAEAARAAFGRGPWRWLEIGPSRGASEALAERHPLRGADLWHLATAVTMRKRLPELELLTYDRALREAASAEGL